MSSLNQMVDSIEQNKYEVLVLVYALAELITLLCMSINAGGGVARNLLFLDIFSLTLLAGIAFEKCMLLFVYTLYNCSYYTSMAIKMPMHEVFTISTGRKLNQRDVHVLPSRKVRSLFLKHVIVYGAASTLLLVVQWMVYNIVLQQKKNAEKKSSDKYDRTSTLPLCSALNIV